MDLKLSQDKKFLNVTKFESIEELEQIEYSLTKKIKNFRFHPSVKNGRWDGSVRFFDSNKNRLPSGLWKTVYDILKKYGYSCNLIDIKRLFDNNIDYEDFKSFSLNIMKNHKITPREYQMKAAFNNLKFRRSLSLLSTSAGKTLITYLMFAYGLEKGLMKNVLMIVPNVSLVVQGNNDFLDYNLNSDVNIKIKQVYHGGEPVMGENITIGTYQSLVKLPSEYFKVFDTVVIDETHKAGNKSIKTIMDNLHHCNYRLGMTGTLPDDTSAEFLTIASQTGPIVNNVNASTLIDEGFITPIKILVLKMDYADQKFKESLSSLLSYMDSSAVFQKEKKFISESEKRLDYVCNVINKSSKNSLVLFHLIDHGKALFERLTKISKDKKVLYVDGNTKTEEREIVKKTLELDSKKTYYTFEFDNFKIRCLDIQKIKLKNGEIKLAKDVSKQDEVCDKFLKKYIKKNG